MTVDMDNFSKGDTKTYPDGAMTVEEQQTNTTRHEVEMLPEHKALDGGLKKTLKDRHLSMIALGGALGTGLLIGT